MINNLKLNQLVTAIREFEVKGHDYYEDNYKKDPAELDANFYDFSTLHQIGTRYGINNVEKIIFVLNK